MSKFATVLIWSLVTAIALFGVGIVVQHKKLENELLRVQQLMYAYHEQIKQQAGATEEDEQDEEESCFTPKNAGEDKSTTMQLHIQTAVLEAQPQEFAIISPDEEEKLKQLKEEYNRIEPEDSKFVRLQKAYKHKKSARKIRQAIALASDFSLHWPLERHEFWLSSVFGWRRIRGVQKFHYGVDMAAVKGTKIKAAAAGYVLEAGFVPGYGNTILIEHNNVYRTRYAHLHSIAVKQGAQVQAGQYIGKVGDTGHTLSSHRGPGRDRSHLHFEVYKAGVRVNPLRYLLD